MKYKHKVSDYVDLGERDLGPCSARGECEDVILASIWRQIIARYPEKHWDEIYLAVKDDLDKNYDIKVTLTISKKEEIESNN